MADFECERCEREFDSIEFDSIDDEVNEMEPLCPNCQEASRIEKQECEYCDKQATHEAGDLYLCEDCFEDWADGFRRD